ncbi:hypothetical protein OAF06_00180 [Akkermansiaceae bacterium]|nr:hypothetical protein [Akkermansiaceae bacterium]
MKHLDCNPDPVISPSLVDDASRTFANYGLKSVSFNAWRFHGEDRNKYPAETSSNVQRSLPRSPLRHFFIKMINIGSIVRN